MKFLQLYQKIDKKKLFLVYPFTPFYFLTSFLGFLSLFLILLEKEEPHFNCLASLLYCSRILFYDNHCQILATLCENCHLHFEAFFLTRVCSSHRDGFFQTFSRLKNSKKRNILENISMIRFLLL